MKHKEKSINISTPEKNKDLSTVNIKAEAFKKNGDNLSALHGIYNQDDIKSNEALQSTINKFQDERISILKSELKDVPDSLIGDYVKDVKSYDKGLEDAKKDINNMHLKYICNMASKQQEEKQNMDALRKKCDGASKLTIEEVIKEYQGRNEPMDKLIARVQYKEDLYKKINDKGLDKYVQESFDGVGLKVQDNYYNYMKANVWCKSELSNKDKILIMRANFEKLSPKQRVDFNVVGDDRVLLNEDFSDWQGYPVIDWPDYPGLDKEEKILPVTEETLDGIVDRIGYVGGKNFTIVSNDGMIYSMDERAIPYIENEYAYHQYNINIDDYFNTIKCIANNDLDGINSLVDKINSENNSNIEKISKEELAEYNVDYSNFIKNELLDNLCREKNIDATYGLLGKVAPMYDKATGEILYKGGATQLNTPISGAILKSLGILKEYE